MKYKVISTDFDGTLLTSDKKVTDRVQNILLKYKKQGYLIVGITARNLSSVKSVCDIKLFNYLILNNGAFIYDTEKEQGKNIGSISKEEAMRIIEYFYGRAVAIDVCSTEKYYRYRAEITRPRPFAVKINSLEEVEEPICRLNVYGRDNAEIMDFKQYIDTNFTKVDTILMLDTDNKNSEKWITLNPKDLNKYSTLKYLCNQENITTQEVVFFGDGLNDMEIIQGVGLGIAMENAVPELKEEANLTIKSNDNNGIAEFLENNLGTL